MFAVYNTKIGKLKIEYDSDAITGITSAKNEKEQGIRSELSDKTALQLEEYFDGKRKEFDISIKLIGTEFQKKVWNELLKIPYGETVSYKDIAINTGNPKACRAVGMANHNNPILIIVPCHRVINENKKLGGYALGLDLKRRLLELEKENS
ncbi:methylated-DNA--protein-cysteine methyltransferase [Clostridium sp. CAG:354]|jgi:methylated-DNA-[protein]-cysteine S-methyltransferase|nr:methylated-DNA--[protein]-cysteine S-methyltransferase [Clostridium sp.]MEE0269241.1 methylated-DNA--[protein]-cysteine S-methyltransferase [Clostridia bacterium]CDE10125.1 methylated-DNA--protein-cysteine methyltransferase [Clostridium sp. CAG:354]